ncbi:unnamed protein product [Rotaria magnacalcarata]|uniref:TIR domain-containing protein n=1 Tax=Rotaria magnacalcarata TaxID=392030 RepID=A0A819K038_9BILA|nr:unnamed protein product [Rotaria magnacalcarata]CAF3942284.1 unnamed protein product [Rotaria magnacalcarata]
MDDCRRKASTNKFSFSSQEIRNIISGILNLEFSVGEKVPDHTKVNQALFSTSSRTEDERTNGTNTYKGFPTSKTKTQYNSFLYLATQGLFLLVSDSSDTRKTTAVPINTSKNLIRSTSRQPDQIVDEIVQLYSQDSIDRERTASTFCNIRTATTQQEKKRHIMINYNRSSRRVVQKIYNRLLENKYIVWMDKVNMGDDILVSMANAVENLYIVLLCINQHYYESHYCRLEVEYAAEKRIKFIACLMEKSFRAGSWLGIIKGSSLHVDFSSNAEFNGSSNELIRLITNIEKQLCLNPRRTPTPCRSPDALRFIAISPSHAGSSTCAHRQFANRVESIIEQYKRTIGKEHHPMKHLKTHELLQLIEILRQPAPKKKSISSYCSYQSEGDSKMINADRQSLEKICNRILDQNERLINIVLIMMGIFVLSVFFVQRNNTL